MKFKLFAFITLLIVLGRCAPIPSNLPETTITFLPTDTKESPTPLPTIPITTPTISIDHSLEKCLKINTENPTEFSSSGFLILSEDPYGYQIYKMNMETKEISETPDSEIPNFDLVISPDGKHIAHDSYETDNEKLIVSDISGKVIKSIPWKEDWSYLAAWLDDQNLIIGTTSEEDKTTGRMSSTFMVFNPYTNESQTLLPNFPNIYENYSVVASWSGWRETVYNQTLDRVVYLRTEPDGIEFSKLALWDIERKQELANFDVFGDSHSIPHWSPDSSKFAFAASLKIQEQFPAYELRSVGRDGQVIQLTNLTKYYPWVYIDNFSWSPDGRYIAFWFSWWSDEEPGWELQGERLLAILDVDKKEVTNYCIQGAYSRSLRMSPPLWSPNGRQVVVESHDLHSSRKVVLLDVENQVVIQIVENLSPLGWMIAP